MEGLLLNNVRIECSGRTIPASGNLSVGTISMSQMRELILTARGTYDASATLGLRLNLYYSPDGESWDTVPFAYYDVDLTAGSTIQESAIVDPPSTGYLKVTAQNQDATYSVTAVEIWSSYSRWGDEYISLDKKTMRRELQEQKEAPKDTQAAPLTELKEVWL